MGIRNVFILFFSVMALSLVILIVFFSLFFKNIDLNFNTRVPESAPDLQGKYGSPLDSPSGSKAEGVVRSTINVPQDYRPVSRPGAGLLAPKDTPPEPETEEATLDEPVETPLPEGTPEDRPGDRVKTPPVQPPSRKEAPAPNPAAASPKPVEAPPPLPPAPVGADD